MMDEVRGKSEREVKAMILYEMVSAKNITKKQKIKMLELNIERHNIKIK